MWLLGAELQKGLPTPRSFPFAAALAFAVLGAGPMGSAIVAKLGMKRLTWYGAVASSEMGCAGGTAMG